MCRAPVVCSEDRLAHGRNTKQNRSSWFSAHFQCFVTCSLLQAMRREMLALLQIRSRCCGTLTVQQSKCLALLSTTWALGSKTLHAVSTRWGSPEERFQQSFTLSSTMVQRGRFARFTGHRSGDAPSGLDWARLRRQAPIGAGLSRAASTVPSWHGLVLLDCPQLRCSSSRADSRCLTNQLVS